MQQATIFGRGGGEMKITKYQQQVNEAAVQLALQTPSLLTSRQVLLNEARKKVNNDGYVYKKGKSRSKQFSEPGEFVTKRMKTSEDFRVKRISALEEDIKDFNDRLSFKEKRRTQASNSRNYKLCDMLTEEMSTIKQQKREREAELHQLKRKQRKSSWYMQKKNKIESGSHISESEDTSSHIPESDEAGTNTPSCPTSPQNLTLSLSPSPFVPVSTSPVSPHSCRMHSMSQNACPDSPTYSSGRSTPYTSISTDHSILSPSPCNFDGNTVNEESQHHQHFQ